jgi:peptidase E
MKQKRLLLLSNSKDPDGGFLVYCQKAVQDFLGKKIRTALFIPYASVYTSFEQYTRAERIAQFTKLHPDTYVVGLREGTLLEI